MIDISLDGHCIETAARKLRTRLEKRLLEETAQTDDLAADFELLTEFLSTADFPRLRASHPTLMGTVFITVRLGRERGSVFLLTEDGERVLP